MIARLLSFLRQPWSSAENRAVLLTQMAVVAGASLLFALGYKLQRTVPGAPDRDVMRVLISGWDGFAWIVWPMTAPAILLLIRRFPLIRGQIVWSVSRLTIGSIGLITLVTNARFLLRVMPWGLDGGPHPVVDWNHYANTTLALLPVDFLTYCGFFSATCAIDYFFKFRRRQEEALQLRLRTVQLESELAQAELSALRGQLHPHFLFNSFNAVSTLIRQQRNEAATEMIAQLSALLRYAIERTGQHELRLEQELDFIRRYLEIERIRFGDKLQLRFEIDPETLPALVPNLVLQPLVENAIKHGISRRTKPGSIAVRGRLLAGRLEVVIENDGADPGGTPAVPGSHLGGIGLSNTRRRLERVYAADYQLDLIRRPDGGMRVQLNLPFVPAAEP